MFKLKKILLTVIFIMAAMLGGCGNDKTDMKSQGFLNVSYDPTREFYADYNEKFKEHWEKELGNEKITITQLHDGSGRQTRAVIGGLKADVVTLAHSYHVMEIRNVGLINNGWQNKFPYNSSPYTSTVLFLVRAGNPKNIHDWDDLIRDDIKIVTPNPKTSGGGQWNYLSAWEYARRKFDGNEIQIIDFMERLYKNVLALDNGARGTTTRFIQLQQGDVLITWESEALLAKKNAPEDYEIITPSLSILAEPSVAIVDKVVDKKGTRELAEEYLNYLYSPEAQEIAAQNFYRPRDEKVLDKYRDIFNPLKLFTIDEAFGGWRKAYHEHFGKGGTFERIYKK